MSRICPKCNREFQEEYITCPFDQTPLISRPNQPAGFSLDLGDANAISGGVNLSDNHSITNTSNVDSHNIITNNITQVERNKTPEELKHEKELAFREECLKAYGNGIMTYEDKRQLEDLQYCLGIDDVSANKILSEVAKRSERKISSLSPVHQITYNNIKTALHANRLDLVNRLMAQMKAMVQRYSVEEIQFTYYMLQAVLHPKECVEEYKCHYEDKYWQTFWTSIAYRRIGNIVKSELLGADIGDKWADNVPQDNTFILAAVNALIDKDVNTAKVLYDNICGDQSPYLSNLSTCLYTLLYGDMLSPEELKQWKKDTLFYTSNLFADTHEVKPKVKELNPEAKQFEEEETQYIIEEKHSKEESCVNPYVEESKEIDVSESKCYDSKLLSSYVTEFGYLRQLEPSEIVELKTLLLSAPKDDYKALFCLGQLYIQEDSSAVTMAKAYNAINTAAEHGVGEAGAYMAYFYLYGKVVLQDLDEAEQRIKIDDDFKKNPVFMQMLADLYTMKGDKMLADVWKSKLMKLK